MQGVIKSYDPGTGDGVVINEADLAEIDLAADALQDSLFRMLRQGQRVNFEVDADGRDGAAARVRGRHGDPRPLTELLRADRSEIDDRAEQCAFHPGDRPHGVHHHPAEMIHVGRVGAGDHVVGPHRDLGGHDLFEGGGGGGDVGGTAHFGLDQNVRVDSHHRKR